MGKIWVKEFVGGLDKRRLPETTSGGVLIKAKDGHITRGGEFEKRAAFVRSHILPADSTVALAEGKDSLYVFGHDVPPTMPTGVMYQRLQHPDGVTALVKILSCDMYKGKLYVVGEFADGGRYHFYDGVRIADWFDGRARASFRVVSGTGGSSTIDITVDGVSVMAAAVTWTTSNTETAALIADAINSHTSTPDYEATSVGETVNIISATPGTDANGRVLQFTLASGFVIDPTTTITMDDGADPTPATSASGSFKVTGGTAGAGNKIDDITIDGVSILGGAVLWTTSHAATATAIASAINSYVSTPDYTATANSDTVTITAVDTGPGINGQSITVTVSGTVTVGSIQAMAGGADAEAIFTPGTFVKTIGSRMHSVSGALEHFSGIRAPTKWTTDTVGAGFTDMSQEASGSEELTALAKYQNYVAVFAARVIQIWYFDSDPSLNAQKQVLSNTGTDSPRSVVQFGDNDLFYLDESGVRSLRARDASNAASTTDVGVPIDDEIIEKRNGLTTEQRKKIIGVIEPSNGRVWLAMNDEIFVFSFFSGAKVSAWSTYTPTSEIDGQTVSLTIDDMVVFRRKVYIRSGDDIYVYGGTSNSLEYDSTEAEAWVPYLDANDPAREKTFKGLDVACRGLWEISAAYDPSDEAKEDKVATVSGSTFNVGKVDGDAKFHHISLRFRTKGSSYAKLGSVLIHYDGDADED